MSVVKKLTNFMHLQNFSKRAFNYSWITHHRLKQFGWTREKVYHPLTVTTTGLCKSILGDQLLHLGYILGLGIVLTYTLLAVPGVPLSLSLQIEHSRAFCIDVPYSGLFVQTIQLT